jgi:hypothetical protein
MHFLNGIAAQAIGNARAFQVYPKMGVILGLTTSTAAFILPLPGRHTG